MTSPVAPVAGCRPALRSPRLNSDVTPATFRGVDARAGRDPLTWIVAALLVVPMLVAVLAALGRSGWVTGDLALIELALRDTGTSDTPLVGAFSRYGWNHPGPLMFWVLAPLYRLLGSNSQAMYAAAAVVNAFGLVVLAWVARRFGGRRLLVAVGAGVALLMHGAGTTLADPWNPYFPVVPFAVFMLSAAAVAAGDIVLIPLALGAGSLVVQSHVSYMVPVASVACCCIVVFWGIGRTCRRAHSDLHRPQQRWPTMATSMVVLAGSWAGPVIDQLRNSPGNLAQIGGFFLGVDVRGNVPTEEASGGLRVALGALGRHLRPFGPWVGGVEVGDNGATTALSSAWWAVPAIAGLLVVLRWARRRSHERMMALGGIVLAGVAGAFVASMSVRGDPYWYLLRFWWPLAMFVWIVILWWMFMQVPRAAGVARGTIAVVSVAAVLATGINSVSLSREPAPLMGAVAVTALADDVTAGLVANGTYLVEPAGWSLFWEMFGFMNLLDARGFTPVTGTPFLNHVGPSRVVGGVGAPAELDGRLIVAMNRTAGELSTRTDLDLLASFDPLSSDERVEAEGLMTRVRSALTERGRVDLADQVGNLPLNLLFAAVGVTGREMGIPDSVTSRLEALENRGPVVAVYLAGP